MTTIGSLTSQPPAVLPHPLGSTSGTSASSSSSSNSTTPSNQLDANSFITLLAAQLQAQDPLNPLDPNQMVNELTSMNTLQQTIQIRQDLDALVKAAQTGSAQPAVGTPGSSPASALFAASSPNTVAHNAALAAAKFALSQASSKL